jgi:hypothetical protein
MDYETIQRTIYNLLNIRELFTIPENWGQSHSLTERAVTLDQAFALVGVDNSAYHHHVNDDNVYPGDLSRGQIPEAAWFVREAMNKIAPEFEGLIYKWNDAPERMHEDVLNLVTAAINLAKAERAELWASDSRYDTTGFVLNRWGSCDGSQVCAMSALSLWLGYRVLTDQPAEVNVGLAALVNLLNDRATDEARQLLASRLPHIPHSGGTNIASLIGRVFFPLAIKKYGYQSEVNGIAGCVGREQYAEVYDYLSERFLELDGSSNLASGCAVLTASLRANNPVKQDLLAVSAASQLISFEVSSGWTELLQILDFIIGIEDRPFAVDDEPSQGASEHDANPPVEVIYDSGIKVQWFPALVTRFPDQLEAIAEQILDEVAALDSVTVYTHRFLFENEEVMIVTSWNDDLDMLSADADLVAYLDPLGVFDVDGTGETSTLMVPVPASEAETIH